MGTSRRLVEWAIRERCTMRRPPYTGSAGPPPRAGQNVDAATFVAVPRNNICPTRHQRAHGRGARSGQAQNGVCLVGPSTARNHRSFSVDRPASASTRLMIQKRMTTVGSDQPSCSK